MGLSSRVDSSLGYRDVLINLRIVSQETVRLGVEIHVCEVQLVLDSFWMLKVRMCICIDVCVCMYMCECECLHTYSHLMKLRDI